MTSPAGGRVRADGRAGRRQRRASPATLVSVVFHVLVLLALLQTAVIPIGLTSLMNVEQPSTVNRERVRYVAVSPQAPVRVPAGVRPSAPTAPPREQAPEPLVAPREVPSGLPPIPSVPAEPPTGPGAAAGPLAGGTGATRGVMPTFEDPRVWTTEPSFIYAPKTDEERLDSALITTLARYQDSVAASAYSPNRFERGDWTVERDGKKYGIDQRYIHLGKFSIPTALLALLPLNRMQPNPIAAERDRAMMAMREDILYHAQASLNEEQFRQAVRAIRERKDRLDKAEDARRRRPGVIISPGERPPP